MFHFIFPVGTSLVLIYSVYKAFYPLPVHPYNWSPFIAGGWLIAGVVILLVMRARGNEAWLKKAGDVIGERIETPRRLLCSTRTRCDQSIAGGLLSDGTYE